MPSLILTPSAGAVSRKLAGFHSGAPLKLNFKAGESVSQVMHRFNEYRSPDNQIESVFKAGDLKEQFPLQTLLYADQVVFVA